MNALDAEAAKHLSEYLKQENEIMSVQQKDPLVDLKAQELELRQQQQMQDARQDQLELQLDKQKLAEQSSIARERIESTEDIADMRAEIARERTANKGGQTNGRE